MSGLRLRTPDGSIKLVPEDGTGDVDIVVPRGGFAEAGKTWHDMTSVRVKVTLYTNDTVSPLHVLINAATVGTTYEFIIDGVTIGTYGEPGSISGSVTIPQNYLVPPGSVYSYTGNFTSWFEFRL